MSLKINLILSIILHVVVIISLLKTEFLVPVTVTPHERPIIARLVEPAPIEKPSPLTIPLPDGERIKVGVEKERPAEKDVGLLERRVPVKERPDAFKKPAEEEKKEAPAVRQLPTVKLEEDAKPRLGKDVSKTETDDNVVDAPEKDIVEEVIPGEIKGDKSSEAEEIQTLKEGAIPESGDALSKVTAEGSAKGRKDVDEKLKETGPEKGRALPSGKALFDQEIIEGIARKGESGEKQSGSGVTFDAKELKSYSYMMKLKRRIESIWIYPPEAARRGIFGDLLIRFTIKKDGRLGAVELIRTSGYRELDEAALKALRDGEPYWPLPEKWETDAVTIEGHFIYNLYGTYLR